MLMNKEMIENYRRKLREDERAENTINKYIRDIKDFYMFLDGKEINKEIVMKYKQRLSNNYKGTSANSMLAAVNGFLSFMGQDNLKVKFFKIQKKTFRDKDRELSKEEYARLIKAAGNKGNERLSLLMQSICTMGIRVSEHKFITAEALRTGRITIVNKGRERAVFMPKELRELLLAYCKKNGIKSGAVFVTRGGRPMNRSNIWSEMKKLCETAGVDSEKVFPHNLRHLFALTYYRLEKDIVRLADILGHYSVETTRIYTYTSTDEHAKILSKLGLII